MALTDKEVRDFISTPDKRMLADGGGLFLVIAGKSATWQLKYMHHGKSRTMGLGPYPHVTLEDARIRRAEAVVQRKRDRLDPLEVRRTEERSRRSSEAKGMAFDDAVEAYLKDHGKRWTDPKAVPDWRTSLKWASPTIGKLDVADVDRQLVLKVLKQDIKGEPLWTARPVQAKRVRARMQSILEWAVHSGAREEGPNPAEWSRLKAALPAHSRVHKIQHHDYIPADELAAFMAVLKPIKEPAARALRFLLLTATRTGDVLGMKWREVDTDAKLWVIPAERFKTRRAVRVPLSDDAVAILTDLKSNRDPKALVFGSLSPNALVRFMRKHHATATPHGTARATFRTWCASTGVAHEVAEAALGHVAGNAVVQAYQHSDFLDARVTVMDDWAKHCRGKAKPASKEAA